MSKVIPEFENENEEREFWAEQDSTEYLNWSKAKKISFSELKAPFPSVADEETDS